MMFFFRKRKYRELTLELALLVRCLSDKCLELESSNSRNSRWLRFLLDKDPEFIKNRKNWNEEQNEIFDAEMSGKQRDYGTIGIPVFEYDVDERIEETLERIEAILEKLHGQEKD